MAQYIVTVSKEVNDESVGEATYDIKAASEDAANKSAIRRALRALRVEYFDAKSRSVEVVSTVVKRPFQVKSWTGWGQFRAEVEYFDTEAEARAYVATLTAPLVDLVHVGADWPLIGVRRLLPFPNQSPLLFKPQDTAGLAS